MTDTTVPCPMCGLDLFQNDKRAETRSDSMYCGSLDCGLSLLWVSQNDVTRFRTRFSDALAATRADGYEQARAECQACVIPDGNPEVAKGRIAALVYRPATEAGER